MEKMNQSMIMKAANFAAEKHKRQCRNDAGRTPYINHPLEVANILMNEAGIHDEMVIVAALLHDTIEDTDTTAHEIAEEFNIGVMLIVLEVSDNKALPKMLRKQQQIDHAATISDKAKLVKMADKIANMRDIVANPPANWPLERKLEYFDWAKAVVDAGLRGVVLKLDQLFDEIYATRGVIK
jgi:guanosine-3',5'-bis(diphosphate) 3'-pyrophosphohydrolase